MRFPTIISPTTYRFVGGEAQFYAGDLTFYGQGGYIDVAPARPAVNQRLDDGFFARGVVRWFLEPDTRVQLEGGYAGLERVGGGGQGPGPRDLDIYTWGARYDTRLRCRSLVILPVHRLPRDHA
jgi:hypothetical protein